MNSQQSFRHAPLYRNFHPAECYEDLPESLTRLEPRLLELVVNEILDSSGRLAWEVSRDSGNTNVLVVNSVW